MIEKLIALNHLFFKINNLSREFLMFIVFSGLALYSLAIYKIEPKIYLQGETIGLVIIPAIAIPGLLFIMPRFFGKTPKVQEEYTPSVDNEIEQLIAGNASGSETIQESPLIADESESSLSSEPLSEIDKLIADAPLTTQAATEQMDVSNVQETIDECLEPMTKKIEDCQDQILAMKDFKDQLAKVKKEIKIVQNSTKLLPEAYRDALVDLKAFQSEIQNPLKFLEKYTDESGIANFTKEFEGTKEAMKDEDKVTLDTTYPKGKTRKYTKTQMKEKSSFIELLLSKDFTIEEALKFIAKNYNYFDNDGEPDFHRVEDKELFGCITDIQIKYGYPIPDLVTELYKLSLIIGANNQAVDQYYAKILTEIKNSEEQNGISSNL